MSFRVCDNMDSEPYPARPGEPDCAYYLRSGYCTFGINCRFNHSPVRKLEKLESASSPNSQQEKSWNRQFIETSHRSRRAIGYSASFSSSRFGSPKGKSSLQMGSILPVRPGQPECPFYIRTGDCEFGTNCRFDHRREDMIRAPDCLLNPMGYPLRPGEGKCIFYSRYGLCKFGSNCKFDHSIAAPKSIVTDSIVTSASSVLPALTLSSKGSPVAGPSKSRHFPSSN